MTRRNKIILLLILLALECVLLFWCRNRYMTVLSSGTVYESPASVDFKPDFAERNYLSVYIPVTSAVWVGKNAPEKGKEIYLIPGKNVDGMLFIRRARETAEVLVSELAGAEGVQVTDKLIQTSWALTSSQLIREGRPLILVSHQPILQSYLLSIASAGLKFAPASMAVIRYDVAWREGKLLAFLTPGLCRMIEDSYRESEEE